MTTFKVLCGTNVDLFNQSALYVLIHINHLFTKTLFGFLPSKPFVQFVNME